MPDIGLSLGREIGGGINRGVALAGNAAASAFISPLSRTLQYGLNGRFPNLFPSLEDLVDLYNKGGCDYEQLASGLGPSGVQLLAKPDEYASAIWWRQLIEYGRQQIPLDVALRANALEHMSDTDLDTVVKRTGFRIKSDRDKIIKDTGPLDLRTILQLFDRDVIDEATLTLLLLHAGYRDDTINQLVRKESNGIDYNTAITLLNRDVITSDDLAKYQKWQGYRDDDVRKQLKETRWQWPSLTQLIQWGQLGVVDNVRANNLGLDSEKPVNFSLLAKATGQHWTIGDEPPKNWPFADLTPSDLNWRAHWRPNDIGTAITMWHRLRTTGGPGGGPRVPGVSPYTDDDLSADMAANAIPPGRRDQLKAVTYSLPRFSVFKTAMSSGVLSKDEVSEQLQDIGYSPDTAKILTQTWEHQAIQKQVDKLRPVSLSSVKEAYRLGTISRNDAARGLYIIYLSDYTQILDYFKLPLEAQYSLALGNGFVGIALTSIEADIAGELAKQAINVIKEGYMRLEIDATQAMSQLAQIGIVPQRAQQYVQLWTYEHAIKGIEVKAGELKKWYEDHLIDQPTYVARLTMLGYGQGDVALMVTRANLDMSERAMKLQAQTVKAAQLQARQLQAAAKAAAANQRAIQRAMCSSGTRNQVATWTVKGLITYPEGWKRLQECGMTPDDAINLIVTKQPKKGGLDLNGVKQKVGEQPAIGSAAK